jgi:hypothetical protein
MFLIIILMHDISRLLLKFTGVNLLLVLWMVLSDSMIFEHLKCKLSHGIFLWLNGNVLPGLSLDIVL